MKPLIIFYDEPCVLCNYWVQRLCRWDKKDQLRFTSLDHPSFLAFAEERGLDLNSMDTSVVWDQEYSYALEAEATFMILNRLGGYGLFLPYCDFYPKVSPMVFIALSPVIAIIGLENMNNVPSPILNIYTNFRLIP